MRDSSRGAIVSGTDAAQPQTITVAARVQRLQKRLSATGAGWAMAGALLLALAAWTPWLSVALVRTYYARDLPVSLGWGPRGGVGNYALVCIALAGVLALRALSAWLSYGSGPAYLPWWRPLSVRTCVAMAILSLSVSLLYIYQYIMVDFATVTLMVGQQDQASLVFSMLGYHVPFSILFPGAFSLYTATPWDRFRDLFGFVFSSALNPGLLLPIVGSVVLALGAFRRRSVVLSEAMPSNPGRRDHYTALYIAAAVLGLLLLRAPAGLLCQWFGGESVSAGNAQSALTWYSRASALAPTLDDLPSFHQDQGEAEYLSGNPNTLDAGLYFSQQYRSLGETRPAVSEDQRLTQTYGSSAMLTIDTSLSLEDYIFLNTYQGLLPSDNEQFTLNPNLAGSIYLDETMIPSIDELVQASPDNLFAYYLRGRILYAQHDYERAAESFDSVLTLTTDDYTKSSAYTYLAFCAIGLGDEVDGRIYLAKAEKLDSGYYNTTARQAASGLH